LGSLEAQVSTKVGLEVDETVRAADELLVSEGNAGPPVFRIGDGSKINEGSSLRRKWIVLEHPESPVTLRQAGLTTGFRDGSYLFSPVGEIECHAAIRAIELQFDTFDVFADHLKRFALSIVQDCEAGDSLSLATLRVSWQSPWWFPYLKTFLTSVSHVSKVRLANGDLWRADSQQVDGKLRALQLRLLDEPLSAEQARPEGDSGGDGRLVLP